MGRVSLTKDPSVANSRLFAQPVASPSLSRGVPQLPADRVPDSAAGTPTGRTWFDMSAKETRIIPAWAQGVKKLLRSPRQGAGGEARDNRSRFVHGGYAPGATKYRTLRDGADKGSQSQPQDGHQPFATGNTGRVCLTGSVEHMRSLSIRFGLAILPSSGIHSMGESQGY